MNTLALFALGIVFVFLGIHVFLGPLLRKYYPPCDEDPWRPLFKFLTHGLLVIGGLFLSFLGCALTTCLLIGWFHLFL
jgi:hypothetical protein